MSFDDFQEYILQHILEGWMPEEDYELALHTSIKNNGCRHQCLCIQPRHRDERLQMFPVFYLDSYYERYREGVSPDTLIRQIRENYTAERTTDSDLQINPKDYGEVRDQLVFRLVNYEKNRESLWSCPHVRIADLALTFRWVLDIELPGLASAQVTDEMVSWWGITREELVHVASCNTSRLFPPRLHLLSEMAGACLNQERDILEGFEDDISVLSNDVGINGASAMLYENVLKDYAGRVGSDVFILPSSIHEVILIPARMVDDISWLYMMVSDVNRSVVPSCDYLSDSVYLYDRDRDQIRLAERGR